MAWAYATLGYEAPQLFHALSLQSERIARDGTHQGIANILWAFAMNDVDPVRQRRGQMMRVRTLELPNYP